MMSLGIRFHLCLQRDVGHCLHFSEILLAEVVDVPGGFAHLGPRSVQVWPVDHLRQHLHGFLKLALRQEGKSDRLTVCA